MKSTTVYRRFYTTEAAGLAVTVDLPGFGTPKACLLYFVENSATNDAFDETLQFRTLGIGMIGSTDSSQSSTLVYRCAFTTQMDGIAASGTTITQRQDSTSRFFFAPTTAGAGPFWQGTAASFSTDRATFTPAATTTQTNGHLDCILTFFGGDDLTIGIGNSTFAATAAATRLYSQLTFQPDAVLIASAICPTGTRAADDARLAFGCATRSPALQKGVYWHLENAAGTNVDSSAQSTANTIITYSTNNSVAFLTETISNITTGGWTFTSSNGTPTNNSYIFMAFKTNSPTNIALVDLTTNTTTGDLFSGLGSSGFVPETVFGASVNAPTDNTRDITSPGADGIFLFSGCRTSDSLFYNGTGTLSSSTANPNVTGTSTEFLRFSPGYKLYQTDGTLIGTVSSASSKTALTLVGNAAATLTNVSYLYSSPGQVCAAFGNSDRATTMQVFSGIATTLIANSRGFGTSTSRLELGRLTNFDTRPGYNINTSIASGTARRGWILALKSEEANRRRGGTF